MPNCNICGQSIEIRIFNGRPTPIHAYGACTGVRSPSGSNSGYNISTESFCKQTQCPKCQNPVFHIKHNGGTVWISPPLGPPWEKHACMHPTTSKADKTYGHQQSLRLTTYNENSNSVTIKTEISGVVTATETMQHLNSTLICIDSGEREKTLLLVRFNATHLINQLVTYLPNGRQIWPVDRPDHVQTVLAPIQIRHNIQYTYGRIKCPDCGADGREARLGRHLRKNHSYKILNAATNIP